VRLLAATVVLSVVTLSIQSPGAAAPRAAPGNCSAPTAQHVHPGTDVQRVVTRAGVGATICFSPGTYRLTDPIQPRRGQVLVSDRAVLSGAMRLHFSRHGAVWTAPEHHANGQRNGVCFPVGSHACTYPNDVLRDGLPIRRVVHRSALHHGAYFVDYKTNRVVVPDDPSGHHFRVEVAYAAIHSLAGTAGSGVTVRGFRIQDFASPAQHGAIDTTAPGWVIAHNTVQVNHGAGITSGGHVRIVRNRVLRNGEEGIAGVGHHTLVAHNVVAHNNNDQFDAGWEAGGCKWAVTNGLMVRDNVVHDNNGPGLWTDIDSVGTTYQGNRVYNNADAGIFHEISGTAVIKDNVVTGNGFGKPEWLWGSGILLAASHDVEVSGNTLFHNAEGIGLVQQDRGNSSVDGAPRVLHNIAIRDNVVHLDRGNAGVVEDNGDEALFADNTISWTDDEWYGAHGKRFEWNDTEITAAGWRRSGHDVHGMFH
jgi:parallel beta-helix repeat protein